MAELNDLIQQALLEKQTKIIPENIKKGVTAFGVEGTLEGGSSTEVPVKLFETIEEMNNSTGNEEDDLALVYNDEITAIIAATTYTELYFPDIVVLPEALTSTITIGNQMFTFPYIKITSTAVTMRLERTNYDSITYTSSDGITYTRTDTLGNPISVSSFKISESNWKDTLGYFIKVRTSTFNGLYEYVPYDNETKFATYTNLAYDTSFKREADGYILTEEINQLKILINAHDEMVKTLLIVKTRENPNILSGYAYSYVYQDTDPDRIDAANVVCFDNKLYAGWRMVTDGDYTNPIIYKYTVNLSTNEFTYENVAASTYGAYTNTSDVSFTLCYAFDELPSTAYFTAAIISTSYTTPQLRTNTMYTLENYVSLPTTYYVDSHYALAPTQLTLTEANELLPGKIAYGKNGIITGTTDVYTNINWNEVPTDAIDTSYFVKALDTTCDGVSSSVYKQDAVKNKIYGIQDGSNFISINANFNLTILEEYAISIGTQLTSAVSYTYDSNTGNLYCQIPYTSTDTYDAWILIYNVFTRETQNILIPTQSTTTAKGQIVVDDINGDVYYINNTGAERQIDLSSTIYIEGYKLDIVNSTYTFIFNYTPVSSTTHIAASDTFIRNGKIYISFYNPNTTTNYIYVYKNSTMILLTSFPKTLSEGSPHFSGYLAQRNSIQIDNIRYFMVYSNYALSTLYKLDCDTDTVTELVDLTSYGITAPASGGDVSYNSTAFTTDGTKIYGCNYISNGTAFSDGVFYTNIFIYNITENTIEILPFMTQSDTLGNNVCFDAEIVNNKVYFNYKSTIYILDLATNTVTEDTLAMTALTQCFCQTVFKVDNRKYFIAITDGTVVLRGWNIDIVDQTTSNVKLIADSDSTYKVLDIDNTIKT